MVVKIKEGKYKKSHILVSYLEDNIAKSGAYYARVYYSENNIYADNVLSYEKIGKRIEKFEGIQAIVFVDDFIGTGDSTCEYLKKFNEDYGKIIASKGIIVNFIAICGFEEGELKISNFIEDLQFKVKFKILDKLNNSDKCFSETSKIFKDINIRIQAKNVAYNIGKKLELKWPLGFGNCEATVVFQDNCPNNTLPILWSSNKEWYPLFRRL